MKSKQKPLKQSDRLNHYEQPTIIKSKKKYHTNHIPLSSTKEFSISTNTISKDFDMKIQSINNNLSMIMRASPYRQLPSLESQRKQQLSQEIYGVKDRSVYQQMTQSSMGREIQQEQYFEFNESIRGDNNISKILTQRQINQNIKINNNREQYSNGTYSFSPLDQPKQFAKHNRQQSSYLTLNKSSPLNKNNDQTTQNMREQINNKLQRVYSKVGNFSRQKNNFNNNHNDEMNIKQNFYQCVDEMSVMKKGYGRNNSNVDNNRLCYSSIVYQPSTETSIIPQSMISYYPNVQGKQLLQAKTPLSNKNNKYRTFDNFPHQENRIQQRILPTQPSIIQTYQLRIIQLQKKVSLQGSKILKLQQDLLKQRQLLIKKQKQWLLRENQLLSWIEDNQREMEQMRQELQDCLQRGNNNKNDNSNAKCQTGNNIVVIDRLINDDLAAKNNNITNNNNNNTSLFLHNNNNESQLQQKQSLSQTNLQTIQSNSIIMLLKDIIKFIDINRNWLKLMQRTVDERLDGVVYRVKEQMRYYQKYFDEIYRNTGEIINCVKNKKRKTLQSTNTIGKCDENFLLQSFCPQLSSQSYKVSSKSNKNNNINNNKLTSKYSLHKNTFNSLSNSESKSIKTTTNRKLNNNNLINTNKKSQIKKDYNKIQKQLQRNNVLEVKRSSQHLLKQDKDSNNKNVCKNNNSNQNQYYCFDEVFYDHSHDQRNINNLDDGQYQNQIKKHQSHIQLHDYQLYQMVSLQAMAIQSFIFNNNNNNNNQINSNTNNDQHSQQQTNITSNTLSQQNYEQEENQEENLLSSNYYSKDERNNYEENY